MVQNKKVLNEEKDYNVIINGKNIEITNSIRDYINEKVSKIEKLTNHIINVNVKLNVQKLNNFVDIIIKFSNFKIKVSAVTDNMYSAIDKSFNKLLNKTRKWKEKIKNHHHKGMSIVELDVNILEKTKDFDEDLCVEIEDENNLTLEEENYIPKVAKTKKILLKTLTLEEAVMKMELSSDSFMVYKSEEDLQNWGKKQGGWGCGSEATTTFIVEKSMRILRYTPAWLATASRWDTGERDVYISTPLPGIKTESCYCVLRITAEWEIHGNSERGNLIVLPISKNRFLWFNGVEKWSRSLY